MAWRENKETLAAAVQRVEAALRNEKDRIRAEIHAYPPPIPACDAQFNYLLEKRDRVSAELARLHAISVGSQSTTEQADTLSEFVATSQCLDHTIKSAASALLHS